MIVQTIISVGSERKGWLRSGDFMTLVELGKELDVDGRMAESRQIVLSGQRSSLVVNTRLMTVGFQGSNSRHVVDGPNGWFFVELEGLSKSVA